MENEERSLVLFAEQTKVDLEKSDIFVMITFKLFDNGANRNGQGVTSAFISSIVNNPEKYAALPLYADVPTLLSRRYRDLGHRYDERTQTFETQQIGSQLDFQMVAENDGIVSQLGTARIPKRQADICERIAELYEMGNLNVSFEVKYSPNNVVLKDGIQFVDAADTNYLTGMAVVWTPAYADANALEMVAEASNADSELDIVAENTSSNEGDEKEVPENNIEAVVEETVTAEEVQEEEVKEQVEEPAKDEENSNAEVVSHSITVEETINDFCDGEPPVHVVETTETIVETIEPEPEEAPDYPRIVAEKDARIAELEAQVAELNQMKAEYEQMKAAQAAAELVAKQAKARAFAQKQGLDIESVEVAEAINNLDYEAIASMSMANDPVEENNDTVTIASYTMAGMEIKSKYGDLLDRHD